MAKMKNLILLGVMLILFINFVNAQSFSVDPCAGETTISEDANYYYMDSACFNVIFTKKYNETPISFYDSYNDDAFDLKLFSLRDINVLNENQKQTTSFEDINMTASVMGDTLTYTSLDGKIRASYSIQGNKIKAGLEVDDWVSNYPTGRLELRTRIHKESTATSHFLNLAPIVDGVEQPLVNITQINGENKFIVQTLFEGNSFTSLVIDPLYEVDYSPTPATHLINGQVATESESDFESEIDITAGVSDNSTATKYLTREFYVESFSGTYTNVMYSNLDETSGTIAVDSFGNVNGTYFNSPNLTITGISNTGVKLDGSNEYIRYSGSAFNLNSTDEILICFGINVGSDLGNGVPLIDFDDGSDGILIEGADDEIKFNIDRSGSGNKEVSTTTQLDDSQWHKICFHSGFSQQRAWTDGKLETTSNDGQSGGLSTTPTYLYIGRNQDGDTFSDDAFDEICVIKGSNIPYTGLVQAYNDSNGCSGLISDYDKGRAISGRFSQTYDAGFDWFLQFYKTSAGSTDVYVYAYNNSNDLSNQYVTHSNYASVGWFAINVSSLMDYMANTVGLNYSQFRIYTTNEQNISELRLLQTVNDTTDPTINQCWVDDSNLTCSETATLICNITDDVLVDYVYFKINGTNYTTTKFDDLYKYEISPIGSNTATYEWEMVYATDLATNVASLDPNQTISYNCSFGCVENWTLFYGSCLTNDTQLKYYLDNNSCGTNLSLPVDNGTYVACNYCSEDLVIDTESACYLNVTLGVKNITYIDNNYATCCSATGLFSDCSIDFSPYNNTIFQQCDYLSTDFQILMDNDVFFGFGKDKVFGLAYLNNISNKTYNCVTTVQTMQGMLVQSNPDYEQVVSSIIQLFPKSYENREFFTMENSLANVYWTNENLVIDGRNYLFGIGCSNGEELLISQKIVTVNYESANAPITRWFWIKDNIYPIMIFLIVLLVIVILIGLYFKRFKGQ
jgi:hypothetical protein